MNHELSQEARSLIRDALAEEQPPSSAHRRHLRSRVLARAAAGGVVTLMGASVAKASARSLFSVVASSLGLGFGAGVVLVGAAQLAFSPGAPIASKPELSASARSYTKHGVTPLVPRQAGELPVPVPRFGSEPVSSANGAAVKAHPLEITPRAEASAGSALRAELDLMAQVQAALRDAHGERALDLMARYDERYPNGVLETERLAAEVFAACQVGDRARASRVAQRFLARDGSSALARRVKSACPDNK